MIHHNQAIIYEVGSTSYMQSTQSSDTSTSPPTMSPLNSQDDNGGNLVQDLAPSVHTNSNLQSGLTILMDKIWFIVKIACLVIVLFLALSIFGVGKVKKKKDGGDGTSKTKNYAEKGIFAILSFWIVKKFFGRDINKDDMSTSKKAEERMSENLNSSPMPTRESDNGSTQSNSTGIPPRRQSPVMDNEIPPRSSPQQENTNIPPRRDIGIGINNNKIPPRRNLDNDINNNKIPPRRNLDNDINNNKIPPRDKELWGDDSLDDLFGDDNFGGF